MSCSHKFNFLLLSMLTIYFLSGCVPSGVYLPERFKTIDQVYPSLASIDQIATAPSTGYRKEQYQAPYEDVFRLVEVTAVQTMMTIETIDSDSGIILASKIAADPQPYEQSQVCMGLKNEVRYFYAIGVKELGPTTTQVSLVAKAQGRCCYPGGKTVGGAVGSMMGVPFEEWKQKCLEFSSVHFSDKQEEVLQFFNFMRLNLLNAGLI